MFSLRSQTTASPKVNRHVFDSSSKNVYQDALKLAPSVRFSLDR